LHVCGPEKYFDRISLVSLASPFPLVPPFLLSPPFEPSLIAGIFSYFRIARLLLFSVSRFSSPFTFFSCVPIQIPFCSDSPTRSFTLSLWHTVWCCVFSIALLLLRVFAAPRGGRPRFDFFRWVLAAPLDSLRFDAIFSLPHRPGLVFGAFCLSLSRDFPRKTLSPLNVLLSRNRRLDQLSIGRRNSSLCDLYVFFFFLLLLHPRNRISPFLFLSISPRFIPYVYQAPEATNLSVHSPETKARVWFLFLSSV